MKVNWTTNRRYNMELKSIVHDPSLNEECFVWVGKDEKKSISELAIGEEVSSFDLENNIEVYTEIIGDVESKQSIETITYKLTLESSMKSITLTNSHMLPFNKGGDGIIVDNVGVVEVGDLVIVNDGVQIKQVPIETIEEGTSNDEQVWHPRTADGFYFVNTILIHD